MSQQAQIDVVQKRQGHLGEEIRFQVKAKTTMDMRGEETASATNTN
jgi:hypothetical protein